MAITLGSQWVEESQEWLIDGLLCDSLTLISGQPKAGKSALAVHLIRSLLSGEPLLSRSVNRRFNHIGWMGFDLKWQRELKGRAPDLLDNISFIDPIHYSLTHEWAELSNGLQDSGVDFLVVDHLYGLAGKAELDKQYEVQAVLQPLMKVCNSLNIPILLLTQAGKANDGRAAHSVAIEGTARWLIRIIGSGKSNRTLTTVGNNGESERLKVILNPGQIDLVKEVKTDSIKRNRTIDFPAKARFVLEKAPDSIMDNVSKIGAWYSKQGLNANTVGSGRTFINNLIKSELLTKDEFTGKITAGPKLST